MRLSKTHLLAASLLTTPLLTGARGQGCGGPINSMTPAPDMTGTWAIDYEDDVAVKVKIGGAAYDGRIAASGGSLTITHEGQPITFDLDCDAPAIVCPSEVWPRTVTAEHRNASFPHRFFVEIASQECSGRMVTPDPSECGAGTSNPECDDICDGALVEKQSEHFGVVDEAGGHFDLLLGAGIATNGVNCGLLGVSAAKADLVTTGAAKTEDWEATEMTDGEVVVGYSGACLWAGDPDGDAQLEALVVGASIELRTGFTGEKQSR